MSVNPAAEPTGTLAQALQHAARLLDREPLLAAEQAVEILKVFPAHPGATLLLGSARRAAGNPAAALAVLQALTENRSSQLSRPWRSSKSSPLTRVPRCFSARRGARPAIPPQRWRCCKL